MTYISAGFIYSGFSDIKPENILFSNEKEDANLKIINFGLAATLSAGGGIAGTAASVIFLSDYWSEIPFPLE